MQQPSSYAGLGAYLEVVASGLTVSLDLGRLAPLDSLAPGLVLQASPEHGFFPKVVSPNKTRLPPLVGVCPAAAD